MKLALLGASGHGKVVAEIAELLGYEQVVFFDDEWPSKTQIGPWPIMGDTNALIAQKEGFDACVVSIGSNDLRREKQQALQCEGLSFVKLVHPQAVVSHHAIVGIGTVIMAGAVVNAFAKIGQGCIINTSATVDHDSLLDDFVHISPGAHLAGSVSVFECSWVGVGASVKQGINIRAGAVIGAGAVVITSIPANSVAVGVPAKVI